MHIKRINGYDYYYISVRRKGKITTIYLGQDPTKARAKENALKSNLRIGKIGRPHKYDRNPRFIHPEGYAGPTPTPHFPKAVRNPKREKRTIREEKGQARPLIIIPLIFLLAIGSLFILTQADVSFSIDITSPLNQTYTTQDVDLNVTTGDAADACQWNIDGNANDTMSGSGTDWDDIITSGEGQHQLFVYCTNTSDWGLNSSVYFTTDTKPPYWSGNKTSSQSTYSSTQESCLNITWQDSTSGVNTVYIQGNWSGSDTNYTTANVSSEFYYCAIMPAGTFYWKSWANDTNSLLNSTDTWMFTISQANNPIFLWLNSSQANLSINYGETSNATAYISFGSVSLYRDLKSISNPDIQDLGAGTYVYLANSSGDDNHTANSTYFGLTVNAVPSATTLFLNGSQDNLTQTYGESVNATTYCDYGTLTLYLNSSELSTPYIGDLGAGYWNFTAYCSGDSNHSASESIFYLTVNKTDNPIYLYLNGSDSNLTVTYGNTTNATAYVSYGSVSLYRNDESVSNPDIQNLGAGVYVYVANSTGDDNHTANSTALFNVTILQASSSTIAYLNDSSDDQEITYGETVNATAFADYGSITFYLNGSSISNPYLDNLGAGYWNLTAYSSGDTNHSASEDTAYLTVDKASNPIFLYLNGSQQNMTADYGETTNATAYVSYGTANLYRNGDSVSTPDIQNLGAGVYVYTANSTGDTNHTANSTIYNITVNKIPSITTLFLNSSQDNLTQTYGETINTTAYCDHGSPALYLNESLVSNPYLDTLGTDYWNFTAYCSGDTNHTASEKTFYLTVNKAPNSIFLYLNSSQSNLTVAYGNTTNATAYVTFGSVSLYRNSESVSNPDIQSLAVGTYVYLANTSGDDNHTANSTSYNITMSSIPSITILLLNGTQDNMSQTYGESVNATAYCDFGTPKLILNETVISNPYLDSLGSAYYNFTANCSGDSNHSESSQTYFLTVSKASNPMYLYLNGSQQNLTANYGETTNASAYVAFGSADLYRDNNPVLNPEIANLGAGVHVYMANSSGDQNHTANSTIYNITVNQIPSITTLFLNSSQDNLTQTYGDSVNATAYCDYGSPSLYLNDSSVANPYLDNLASGYYNFTANCSGDSNHSSSYKTFFLTVNKATNPIFLYLNGTQSNLTVTYGNTTNVTAYVSFGTLSFYSNGESISSPDIQNLAAATYIYVANSSGDSNHTSNSTILNITINRAPMPLFLYLNGSQSNQSYSYEETTNATGYKSYSEGSLTLYRNGTDVGNPEIANLPAGYWNYTLYFAQTENYSSNSTTLFATVTSGGSVTTVYFNSSSSDQSITYGETINATAVTNYGPVTLYLNGSSISNPYLENLGAGYWNFTAYSTGDANHSASEDSAFLTVNKAPNPIYLYLNGSQQNLTAAYGSTTNATAFASFGTVILYRNGESVSSPDVQNMEVGTYLYVATSPGDSNHTTNGTITYNITVTQIPSVTTLFLNGTQDNFTQTYGEIINATAYCDYGTAALYMNGSSVTNPHLDTLAVGYWNFTANCSGDSNHSASEKMLSLTIDKAANPISLFLNGSQSNLTVTYGNTTNATAYVSFGTVNLYRNGSQLSNPNIWSLRAGVYVYLANTSGDQNHTVNSTILNVTVLQAPTTTSLFLNGSASNLTITYGEYVNATAYCSYGGVTLYRNGTAVSNPYIASPVAGYWNLTAYCAGDSDHSPSENVSFLTVNKAPNPIYLFLNSTQFNLTATYGNTTNASAYISFGTVNFYRDGQPISSPDIQNFGSGTYVYVANSTGDGNHTANSTVRNVTILQAASTTYLFMNGSQSNMTSLYSKTINATAYCSYDSPSLYLNGTAVSNPYFSVLGSSYWNFTAYCPGNANYTASEKSYFLTVNKAIANITLLINGTNGNFQSEKSSNVNITVYLDHGQSPTVYLYLNGTLMQSGAAPLENVSYYPDTGYYNISANYSGSQNYTSAQSYHFLTLVNVTLPDLAWAPGLEANNSLTSANKTWIFWNFTSSSTIGSGCLVQVNGSNHTGIIDGSFSCYYNETGLSGNQTRCAYGWANDTSNKWNRTEYRCISTNEQQDFSPPDLWFTSPASNSTTTSNNWILVNVSASENLNTCLLDWYNGTWTNVSMAGAGSYCYATMTGLSQGYYYFRVYGNDSAGNLNVTEDRQARYYVAPSQPSGGQSYGGGGPVIMPQPNVTQPSNESAVKTKSVYLEVSLGKNTTAGIVLKNVLNITQTFRGEVTGNITLILSGTFSITLNPREEREITIQADARPGLAPGIYSGTVQIMAGSERYSIPVTVRVLSAPSEIEIVPLKAEAAPGESAQFNVTLHNAGYAKSVRLLLELLSPDDVVIATSEETLEMENGSATGSIMIPGYLTEGTYSIRATASYTDLHNITTSAAASKSITVKNSFRWWSIMEILWVNILYVAAGVVLAAALLILIISLKHRRDFQVKIVKIKDEDRKLTMQVTRFLKKYSMAPGIGHVEPWKISEQPPRRKHPHEKHKATEKKHVLKKLHIPKKRPRVLRRLHVLKKKPHAEPEKTKEKKAPAETSKQTPSAKKEQKLEEKDRELVESLRSRVRSIEEKLPILEWKGKNASSLRAEANSLRRTLNLGASLGHETLVKTGKKLDKLEKEYEAAVSS